jgi:ParB family transcriptional regulator, chromosome partitioning protein
MAKKKPTIEIEEIFKEEEEKLEGELFDINNRKGLINIPLSQLIANPNQPRKTFHEQTISELAESMKQHGVLSPIIVRPSGSKYEIIAGERRFKAAEQAGLKEVPAIIKKVSNGDARIISLIENIQREDLNDIDRAAALRELKVNLGSPWEAIAQRLGLTKRRVLDLVGLLDLPEEIKEDIRQKKLTEKHGRALRQLLDQAEVLRGVVAFLKDKKLTGDQSLELVRKIKSEPGFTPEEAFKNIGKEIKPKSEVVKNPQEFIFEDVERLTKHIKKLRIEEVDKNEKKKLLSLFSSVRIVIDSVVIKMKGKK